MKKRYFVIFMLFALMLVCLAACNNKENYEGQAKITFELEGGDYNNCKLSVIHYYNIPDGKSSKISEVDAYAPSDKKLTRDGYQLEGWYATKNDNGTYSNRWNFDRDTVRAGEELTLYANWEVPVRHSYAICYIDDNNQKVVLDSISAREGDKCNLDRVEQRAGRDGYSIIDYLDADGKLWDENFVHPGGEEDLAIEVYVKYVKGDYTVVKSAEDFGYGNIYLARDIDMGGEKLNLTSFTGGIFEGNGHTISNFTIDYSTSRYDWIPDFYDDELKCFNISIFGALENATISNVTFDNYKVEVSTTYSIDKIYVCPLSGSITECTLTNVKATNFTFTYNKDRLPNGFVDDGGNLDTSKLVIVTDRFACVIDDKTKIEGDSKVIQTVAVQD